MSVDTLAERERLGLPHGGALELVSSPEGVLLERRLLTLAAQRAGLDSTLLLAAR